ncbi:MAG: MarR family winged helix-turn-helix transcriptional regulator [Lachnospiraceae bacterium]
MTNSLEAFLYGTQFRRLMEKELEPVERRYGLQKIDMHILFFLAKSADHNTAKDIVQLNMFTKGHISQSLTRLQKKGYIQIMQDKEDRRCTHNYLSGDADEIIQELKKAYRNIQDIILNGVTEEEQAVLASVAKKVGQNIKNAL